MDAHVFRIAGRELLSLLEGARVEKIHGPEPNVLVFRLFAQGLKLSLLLRFERQNPLLLLTINPPENPFKPSSFVMRLRKYVSNRRLGRGELDWKNRRLAFAIPGSGDDPLWLVLDLRQGASLCAELPTDFSEQPLWPKPALVDSLCRETPESERPESSFVGYCVLTPLLRASLGQMEAMDGRALLIDLEADNDELFAYSGRLAEKWDDARPRQNNGASLKLLSAWPLPDALLEKMELEPAAAIPQPDPCLNPLAGRHRALLMVSCLGEQSFYENRLEKSGSELKKTERKEENRLKRLLRNLESEEARLCKLRAQRDNALILQNNLWRLQADGHFGRLFVPHSPLAACAAQPSPIGHNEALPPNVTSDNNPGDCRAIELDAQLTVLENMEKMFKQSERAARGLGILRERKRAALADLEQAARQVGAASVLGPTEKKRPNSQNSPSKKQKKESGPLSKNIARFVSSDGFIMFRGKNARGNHDLLRVGSPFDIWFHAENGPSAHLIIRRSHAKETIPDRTMFEAGCLAVLKSAQKNQDKARVMCAMLANVSPIKGGPPGAVRVARVEATMLVDIEPEMEVALSAPGREKA